MQFDVRVCIVPDDRGTCEAVGGRGTTYLEVLSPDTPEENHEP
jgi:hypothetical protein